MNNLPVAAKQASSSHDNARLRWRPDVMSPSAAEAAITPGVTLLEGVKEALRVEGWKVRLSMIDILVSENGFGEPIPVPREEWATRLIRPGEFIHVFIPFKGGGSGGKNPLRTLLTIAVVAAAAYVTAGFGAGVAGGFFAAGSTSAALAGAGVAIGGMLLVNAIAPLSTPKLAGGTPSAGKVWSIEGIQNQSDPYGYVPLVLGKVRFAPRYAARPYTLLIGADQYARYLFCVAGHNKVSDLRIGDTDLDNFKGVECVVHENWQGETPELFPYSVFQEDINITLTREGGAYTQTTADGTRQVQLEFYLSSGLAVVDSSNNLNRKTVSFEVLYRKRGEEGWDNPFGILAVNPSATSYKASFTGSFSVFADNNGNITTTRQLYSDDETGWTSLRLIASASYSFKNNRVDFTYSEEADVKLAYSMRINQSTSPLVRTTYTISVSTEGGTLSLGRIDIDGRTLTPFRRGLIWDVEPGQFEVRVRRLTADSNPNDTSQSVLDTTVWSVIRSVQDGEVIRYEGAPLTLIELEIKASDQLSGHIQEFNAVFESYCPVWNGEDWLEEPSSNTAAVAMLICTTPHIHRTGVTDPYQLLSLPSWQTFYEWCEEMGWRYNGVQTAQEQTRSVLANVLASARASITFPDGKLGVAYDYVGKPVVYPFGPRNSWGFKANKSFVIEEAHGLRVRFLNEQRDYQEDERVVYADGYDHDNATNIVAAEFDGVTDPDLIYKLARLRLADSILRPETYEFSTDFAYLCVDKGDRISVTHDVPMWGLRQARVLDVGYADYDLEDMNRAALISLAIEKQAEVGAQSNLSDWLAHLEGMETPEIRALLAGAGLKDTSYVVSIILDDIESMDAGKSYSLKCFFSGSRASTYSIKTAPGSTNRLELAMPIPAEDAPSPGMLASFGYGKQETHDLIIVGIESGEGLTAQITAQDYSADEIYASIDGPIPEWNSDISLPSRWQYDKPERPQITRVQTDEAVLLQLSDGSLIPRIKVDYLVEERQDVEISSVHLQFREAGSESLWLEGSRAEGLVGSLYATNVSERVEYELRVYAISASGVSSHYSIIRTAIVIGRTTPPPAPIAVHIDGNRIWWEMPEDYPIDVRGWEVWMGYDDSEPFSYAKQLTTPYVPQMEFDISRYSGSARRVWIRTVDDAGLNSEPVSIVINLGDILVDNVVYSILEGAERNWPGTIQNGWLARGGVLPLSEDSFWNRPSFWQVEKFWATDTTYSLLYSSILRIPDEAKYAWLSIHPRLPEGGLASVEYRFGKSGPFWNRAEFWNAERFWNWQETSEFQPMPDKLWVHDEDIIQIRITTVAGTVGLIQEIEWIFDVEDELDKADDVEVPVEGIRIPLTKTFRWIRNVNFGLEYQEGASAAVKAAWLDKGISGEDGLIAQGPLVVCTDINNNPVPGVVDVTMQGAKGVRHGRVAD